MNIFINSSSAISPINSFLNNDDIKVPIVKNNTLNCIEPNYKEFINPIKLRRMSRVVKMGVSCGLNALKNAGIENADAIVTATGLGCVCDTEKFLSQMIENNEKLLNPTSFIQSTHNTVSGQIALFTNCNNHNFTFSQNDTSFESALLESQLLIANKEANNVLLGGVDELTEESKMLIKKSGCAVSTQNKNGYICGEGASFFILENKKTNTSLAKLLGLQLTFSLTNLSDFKENIDLFLNKLGIDANKIDTILSGQNTNADNELYYSSLTKYFTSANIINFKKYCGEYHTSTAFAFWLAQYQIHKQLSNYTLICNIGSNNSLSLILLSKC